jgi:hypothetical protein
LKRKFEILCFGEVIRAEHNEFNYVRRVLQCQNQNIKFAAKQESQHNFSGQAKRNGHLHSFLKAKKLD